MASMYILAPKKIGEIPNYALRIMVDLCWQVPVEVYMHLCVTSI